MSAARDSFLALFGALDEPSTAGLDRRLDAHAVEVYTDGARLIEDAACDADWNRSGDYCQGLRAGAELLLARTTETATAPAEAAPEFFQVDHAYTHRHGYDFLCVAVTTHPVTRERLAIGWHSEDGAPIAVGINQWNHEFDGVDGGENRG